MWAIYGLVHLFIDTVDAVNLDAFVPILITKATAAGSYQRNSAAKRL
jgi:hypothetical protein